MGMGVPLTTLPPPVLFQNHPFRGKEREKKNHPTIHPPILSSSWKGRISGWRGHNPPLPLSFSPIINPSRILCAREARVLLVLHPPPSPSSRLVSEWRSSLLLRHGSSVYTRVCTLRRASELWHFRDTLRPEELERALVGTFGINVMAPSRPSLRPLPSLPRHYAPSPRSVNPWLTPVIGLVLLVSCREG